jgi:bacterioferritin-associated ferredoxin
VTDCQIRDAYCEGACSMRDLRKRLGVAGCCGRCAQCARDVLNECRQQQDRSVAPIRVVAEAESVAATG